MMPSGGNRIGAGRKPRPDSRRSRQRGRVLRHPSAPTTSQPTPIEQFDAPAELTADERAVWVKQAPHAVANRTLTKATALSFERYCRIVVLERHEAKSSGMAGPNHRGMLKQLNAYELQFMLIPAGKPMVEPPPPPVQDEDDEFFGGPGNRRPRKR